MKTHIIIPVRDQLHLTQSIVEQLKEQIGWDKCWIMDNGSGPDTAAYLETLDHERFSSNWCPNLTIYEMWNAGFIQSQTFDAEYVAFLNNDIYMVPNTIQMLKNALSFNKQAWISYPDYNETKPGIINYKETKGTYRHGGMSGFCFMVKAKKITWRPIIDTRFRLWYGDDDLVFNIEKHGGKQIRILGLPVQHIGQATTNQHPELFPLISQDRELFIQKWGNK